MKKYLLRLVFFLSGITGACLPGYAGIEPYENFLQGSLQKDDSLVVKDEKFRNPSFNWSDISNSSVKNRVELLLLDGQYFEQDFSCAVGLRIEYYSDPGQVTPIVIDSVTLGVSYNKTKGVSYKQADSYVFEGGHYVKITITDISSPEYGENIPPVLQLSSYIAIDRRYRFEPGVPLTISGNISQGSTSGGYAMRGFNPDSDTMNDRYLELYWSTQFQGAEEYDVEWTVTDNLGEFSSVVAQMLNQTPNLNLDAVFRNNATRVTTSNEFYRISLIYNSDYILARIRPVSYSEGIRIEGDWNYLLDEYNSQYAIWPLNWHENKLNWQYEVSFAEEGKRKEVINYFDGSLRNRQTGTLSNHQSDDNEEGNFAVVQETVYDEFGRPAANILPVPVKETTDEPEYLRYFKNFNRNAAGRAYSFRDIAVGCELDPGTLSTAKGASAYYSPSNQFLSEHIRNRYIPDAEGYPFSLTQYTADNTGRIKIQGGVGAAFQPGGTGGGSRTTKYYYGKPEQWELDHLFGNDVGYAEHYAKNMVIDPNGQISISYLDAGGKTIATALSGVVPENVDAISSSGVTNTTRNVLLKPEQFEFDASALKLKATSTYLASIPDNDVAIHYNIEKLAYYRFNTDDFKPCSNCHYELNITVTDDCGNQVPVNPVSQSVKIGSEVQNANDLGMYLGSIQVSFNHIGEYYITFELDMKRNVIEQFADISIQQGLSKGEIQDEFSYILDRIKDIDFISCLSDCRNAKELLGLEDDFRVMIDSKLQDMGLNSVLGRDDFEAWVDDEYPILLAHATNLYNNCPLQPETPCDIYKNAMLKDLMPGGQYGLYTLIDSKNEAVDLPANILHAKLRLVFPVREESHEDYTAKQFLREDGRPFSPHDANFKFTDLVKYWKPEWAELFLQYHPEYCQLQFCESNSQYLAWDEQVKNQVNSIDDLHQIEPGLAYSYTVPTWLMAADKFFNGPGAPYAAQMTLDLQQYSSRVLGSYYTSKSITQFIDFDLYCKDPEVNQSTLWNSSCVPSCRVPDQEWISYRDAYFRIKEKYYEEYRKTICTDVCEIGSGFGVTSISDAGFQIQPYEGTLYGCSGKAIKIVRTGNFNDWVHVDIKVPAEFEGQLLKKSISLYNEGVICVPADVPFESISVIKSCDYKKFFVGKTWRYSSDANSFLSGNTRIFNAETNTYSGNTSGTWSLDAQSCELTLNGVKYLVESANNNSMVLVYKTPQSSSKIYLINSSIGSPGNVIYAEHMWDETITGTGATGVIKDFVVDNYPLYYSVYSIFPTGQQNNIPAQLRQAGFGPHSDQSYTGNNTFTIVTKDQVYNFNNIVRRSYSSRDYYFYASSYTNSVFHAVANVRYSTTPWDTYTKFLLKPNYPVELRKLTSQEDYYQVDIDFRPVSSGIYPSSIYNDWFEIGSSLKHVTWIPQDILNWNHLYYGDSNDPNIWYRMAITSPANYYAPIDMSSGTPNACDAFKYKLSHFSKGSSYGAGQTVEGLESLNIALLSREIQSACDSRVEGWLRKLEPGLEGNPDKYDILDQLSDRLLALCIEGGDREHPMGASTLPAGYTSDYGDTSFGQIIKSLNNGVYSKAFNPWVIDDIYPYSPLPQQTTKTILKTTDDLCNKLNTLRTERDLTEPSKSLHQFLYDKFGRAMDITAAELTDLEQACSSCNHLLNQPVSLPVFLDPNASNKGCITRTEYNTAKATLLTTELGGTLSIADGQLYEDVLSTYMNHTFGFTMPYHEYQKFESQLNANANDLLCNLPAFRDIFTDPYACFKEVMTDAVNEGRIAYSAAIHAERALFRKEYIKACSAAETQADLTTSQRIYHYTLYYYDQAGNLIRTVPPEGVEVLTAGQALQVAASRKNQTTDCNYTGPTNETSLQTVKANLQTILNGVDGATELWMYDANSTGGQTLIQINKHYMLNYCIGSGRLSAEIYTLDPNSSSNELVITSSKHYSGNVSSVMQWNHIVLQAANMQQQTGVQLWFNGQQLTIDDSPATCGWDITGNPPVLVENISKLKHLRTYNRVLPATEIKANAANGCLMPQSALYLAWHRFNVPNPGDPTTIGANSTQENPFKQLYPQHKLVTSYAYNSNNQVVKQQTPDAGISLFWYDQQSRLLASRNSKQADKVSYTQYDELNRIREVGQLNYGNSLPANGGFVTHTEYNNLTSAISSTSGKEEVTQTVYDTAPPGGPVTQDNLRSRVSASIYKATGDGATINATYYSYDIAGNVKSLWQQVGGLGTKKIDYEYDLVSGKVNFVAYQDGAADKFYYWYEYDAENRLTKAWSSVSATRTGYGFGSKLTVGDNRKKDAEYYYYLHGPLARVELGNDNSKVQGLDYAYTLQGWLKGVNGSGLPTDIGGDGNAVGKDALSYSLGYYNGDYKPIGGTTTATAFDRSYTATANDVTGKSLYNGNISNATYGIANINSGNTAGYTYGYDQLNRLLRKNFHDLSASSGNWAAATGATDTYKEIFSYDANGNITALQRHGASGLMDQLDYHYNRNLAQKLQNNRLRHVKDHVAGSAGSHDLASQVDDNFGYDAIGNLTKDEQAGITAIDWNVYGKIKSIAKTGGNISYSYDAGGNRVSKSMNGKTTYYVRDAQGNSLAVYEKDASSTVWKEQQLYGSSRLGMWKGEVNLATGNASTTWGITGKKFFELSNHLGNVMAVITDKREPLPAGGYGAEVVNANDYYAGGSLMPGRSFNLNSSSYRYGFNGQENDNDIAGAGNHTTALYWEYDTRIGRRWNLDPVKKPWQSDYLVMSGNPIWRIDPDGADDYFNSSGRLVRRTTSGTNIYVVSGSETLLFSEFSSNKAHSKASANIVGFYKNRAGISQKERVGVSPNVEGSMAYANKSGVWVNTKWGANSLLNDYNNLVSTLFHENLHKKNKDPEKSVYKYIDHTQVYEAQISDATFKNTTAEFKTGVVNNYASYLSGAYNNGEITLSDLSNKIDAFNKDKNNVKNNLSIYADGYNEGGPRLYTTGFNNKGEKTDTYAAPAKTPY